MSFDFSKISPVDQEIAKRYIGDLDRPQDLIICGEEGQEYLHRWHVNERNKDANVYFHIQTMSDPERPLHDHPWDNFSVILAGGYDELWQFQPPRGQTQRLHRRQGAVVFRQAELAHRLILPREFKYTMTQFSTGPKVREWGFWINYRWYPHHECATVDPATGVSQFIYPPGTHSEEI